MEPNYLQLIVKAFENAKTTELTFELRERQILATIQREQLRFEKTKQIAENTFITGCAKAVDVLTKFVDDKLKSEKYKNSENSLFHILGTSVKSSLTIGQSFNYETLAVNILSIVPTAKSTVCFNDIKFIQSVFKNIGVSISKEQEDQDLSETSLVQKIIYLNELGIIDLLRKEPSFATSINNLATVISAITGVKKTTVQPVLNSLINKASYSKNYPYNTQSTVDKVKSQLINLGVRSK
ncbi:hypothetical protein QO200_18655 [Flavobacterium sp. Arc3]|uniref:hypothetical protein n=1 Tax=Flavobacterium sp. Arc3 TaxID=3046686 RepID=UPI00352D71A0